MLKLEKEKLTNTSNHCVHCKESSLAVDDRGICRDRMMYKIMCSTEAITYLYRPQRSWGKVMFSQACVILFTGGGGCLQCMLGYHHHPRSRPPPPARALRILLECNLVCIIFGIIMHFHLRMVLWAEVAVGVVVMVEEGLMIVVLVEDGAEEASVMAEILMIPLHMVFHQTNAVLLSEKV